MNDKKPDNVDDFEEEIADGHFKDPMPHFDDEIEYLNETNEKPKGLMSNFFKLPLLSGRQWIVVSLVILIAIFFLMPKGSKKIDNEELIILKSRVEDLENQRNDPGLVEQKVEKMEKDVLKGIQASDRLDQLEMLLIAKVDVLEKEVQTLKAQMEDAKKISLAPKAAPDEPKVVSPSPPKEKKPAKTDSATYHVVQGGENVYRIGLKYNLTESELLELNNLKKGAVIYPGQKLKVRK